jgi:hypothetical protein
MVIPYRRFELPRNANGGVKIAHVVIGPTPHQDPAFASLRNFLISQRCRDVHIEHSGIPLREA